MLNTNNYMLIILPPFSRSFSADFFPWNLLVSHKHATNELVVTGVGKLTFLLILINFNIEKMSITCDSQTLAILNEITCTVHLVILVTLTPPVCLPYFVFSDRIRAESVLNSLQLQLQFIISPNNVVHPNRCMAIIVHWHIDRSITLAATIAMLQDEDEHDA